jgi:aspartate carbamoyltransferase catalytic subunit
MPFFDRTGFSHSHLIGIEELSPKDINLILDLADDYANRLAKKSFQSDLLKGAVIFTLFFENSTRTRVSFELAAKRLGADVIEWDPEKSSLSKGETLTDTILTLGAMGPDAIIVRHSEYNAPQFIAKRVTCPVINAGDSYREHPTQALLDALTLRRHFGRIDGLKVAICGDIAHSRVANSNMILLHKLGAQVNIVAPPYLKPEKFPVPDVNVFETLSDGIAGCDAVMMLRNQKERMQAGLIDSDESFFREYGLTHEKLTHAAPKAVVLHPGPMNRGVEISDALADDQSRSLILKQVDLGVPVRMAVLDLVLRNRK